jgi:hypothetical protein
MLHRDENQVTLFILPGILNSYSVNKIISIFFTISSSDMWWNKGSASNGNLHQLASIINKAPHPLVVSDAQFPNILGLMHILKPETDFQLTKQPSKLMIFDNRENIFLFEPSKILQKNIQTTYAVQAVYIGKNSIPTLRKIVSENSSY